MLPWQPIKFSNLDQIHRTHKELLLKHFSRKKHIHSCSETAILPISTFSNIANFHFSPLKVNEKYKLV